ncbi:MAG: hypothetical protein ACI9H8_000006 [Lysobacterales bacterium]|jgi:hypothetical protein
MMKSDKGCVAHKPQQQGRHCNSVVEKKGNAFDEIACLI